MTQRSTSGFVQSLQNKILNLAIKEKHESLKQISRELELIISNLSQHLTGNSFNKFIQHQDQLAITLNFQVKEVHKRKFNCLVNLQQR